VYYLHNDLSIQKYCWIWKLLLNKIFTIF
jgi:hypothetical protein